MSYNGELHILWHAFHDALARALAHTLSLILPNAVRRFTLSRSVLQLCILLMRPLQAPSSYG